MRFSEGINKERRVFCYKLVVEDFVFMFSTFFPINISTQKALKFKEIFLHLKIIKRCKANLKHVKESRVRQINFPELHEIRTFGIFLQSFQVISLKREKVFGIIRFFF